MLPIPSRISITPPVATGLVADRGSLQLHATIFAKDGSPILTSSPAWSSSAPNRMMVSQTGVIVPIDVGEVVIRVWVAEDPRLTDSVKFEVDKFVASP